MPTSTNLLEVLNAIDARTARIEQRTIALGVDNASRSKRLDAVLLIEITLVTTFYAVLLHAAAALIYFLMAFFALIMVVTLIITQIKKVRQRKSR